MIKNTLILLFIVIASTNSIAQQILSHTTSDEGERSLGCIFNQSEQHNSDNIFFRTYVPSEFGIEQTFDITGVNFLASFNDIGGTDPTVTATIRIYTSDVPFPDGPLNQLGSKQFEVTAADDNTLIEVLFDNPISVTVETEVIIALDIPASPDPPNHYAFLIGANEAGETAPGYLESQGCSITPPFAFDDLTSEANHIIFNLIGNQVLSIDDNILSNISIYPNPTSDYIKFKLPSGVTINETTVYDALGRITETNFSNNQVDITALSKGIYTLKVHTNKGMLVEKLVIE